MPDSGPAPKPAPLHPLVKTVLILILAFVALIVLYFGAMFVWGASLYFRTGERHPPVPQVPR